MSRLFRINEPKSYRLSGEQYQKDCDCGAHLWQNCLPSIYSRMVCPQCGKDWSRQPSPLFRLHYALYIYQKRMRLFGFRKGVLMIWTPFNPLLLPRERDLPVKRVAALSPIHQEGKEPTT